MIIWLWLKGGYDLLMRISIPLLLALVALVVCLVPPTWKWARAAKQLHDAQRHVAQLDRDLSATKAELVSCHMSTDRLTTALENQNAAVDALKADSDARMARADEAIRRAQEQARRYRDKASRIAAARPTADVCESARGLIISTLAEDRR